jgi:hypothetical protein
MTLIGGREGVFAAHIGRRAEAKVSAQQVSTLDVPLPRHVRRILELRQRVGDRCLQVVEHAAGERILPAVVIRSAVVQTHLHRTELRQGPAARVAVVEVHACDRVVIQVDIGRVLFIASACVDDVRLE